jgi:hypothetical protein
MNALDTNQDNTINLGDDMDAEMYELLMNNCDIDGNG